MATKDGFLKTGHRAVLTHVACPRLGDYIPGIINYCVILSDCTTNDCGSRNPRSEPLEQRIYNIVIKRLLPFVANAPRNYRSLFYSLGPTGDGAAGTFG